MNEEQIKQLQADNDLTQMQDLILSGAAWSFEGSAGRSAMVHLRSGACYLPEEAHSDYYGNKVPSRNELEPGSTGTLENSINFWQKVSDGEAVIF